MEGFCSLLWSLAVNLFPPSLFTQVDCVLEIRMLKGLGSYLLIAWPTVWPAACLVDCLAGRLADCLDDSWLTFPEL